jgi:hypothetical protein
VLVTTDKHPLHYLSFHHFLYLFIYFLLYSFVVSVYLLSDLFFPPFYPSFALYFFLYFFLCFFPPLLLFIFNPSLIPFNVLTPNSFITSPSYYSLSICLSLFMYFVYLFASSILVFVYSLGSHSSLFPLSQPSCRPSSHSFDLPKQNSVCGTPPSTSRTNTNISLVKILALQKMFPATPHY